MEKSAPPGYSSNKQPQDQTVPCGLRLPEQPQQRIQQSGLTSLAIQHLAGGALRRWGGEMLLKKILKKVLTFIGEIQYERGWLQKRQRTFAR